MKKRIRKTGEIVDVVSCSACSLGRDEYDWVSYIDSNGIEHVAERGMNIQWDFEDIEENKEINWEQRRYEIARDMMAAFLSNSCGNVYSGETTDQAKTAINYADALIHELKTK